MDVSDLRRAYAALAATARDGPFRDPAEYDWSASQVLAHVIANDRLICAVSADLIDDGEPSFDNETAHRLTVLDAIAASAGDLDALVWAVERQGREVCALMELMDPDIAERRVTVSLVDDGEVRMQGPVAWTSMMEIHVTRHLPGHSEQIRALRA